MRGIFGKLGESLLLRRGGRTLHGAAGGPAPAAGEAHAAMARGEAPAVRGDHRVPDPRQVLAACGMTTWEWELDTDRLAWGAAACSVFGQRFSIASGGEWAAAALPASGQDRATAVAIAEGQDRGDGVAFRCRYVANLARGLCLVEERGAWHAGADGLPLLARGLMRVTPIDAHAADAALFSPRLEPARDVLLRTLAAMLHDLESGRRSVSVVVCMLTSQRPGVAMYGPAAMEAASAGISRRLRRADVVAQLAPGQFGVILAGCDALQGHEAAQAMVRSVALSCPDHAVHAGLVTAVQGQGNAAALLQAASSAAQQALDAGQSLVVLAPPRAERRMGLRAPARPDVLGLLNARAIVLHRRPLAELGGAGLYMEEVAPAAPCSDGASFMGGEVLASAAERAGVGALLDLRTLELAVRTLAREPAAQFLLRVPVATLTGVEWRGALAAWLAAHPGVASRLVIALDEAAFRAARAAGDGAGAGQDGAGAGAEGFPTAELVEPRVAGAHLAMMKALGVNIGVAEYGAGWLSLDDLSAMAVDVVCMSGLLLNGGLSLAGPDRFIVRALADGVRETGAPLLAPAH